ncbi:MAG: hypothetical protein WC895_04165 [Candidatus Shapirobacteria bacterium]|jgi:hypothetical protein
MALMYPWATKEYLLWKMTIGQVIYYHNIGIEVRNGVKPKTRGFNDMSVDELKKIRDDYKKQMEEERKELAKKYGDI